MVILILWCLLMLIAHWLLQMNWVVDDELSCLKGKTGGNKRLNPAQSLLYGAVAGCCAEATVYPLEVVRRQLQLQSISASTCGCSHHVQSQLNGIVTVCMRISSQQGLGGFYSGILVNTIQVLPNAALSYVAYETLKSALNVPQDEGYT